VTSPDHPMPAGQHVDIVASSVDLDNDWQLAEAIGRDGAVHYWLLAPGCGCRRCAPPGRSDATAAPHEQDGPLPEPWRHRVTLSTARSTVVAQQCGGIDATCNPCLGTPAHGHDLCPAHDPDWPRCGRPRADGGPCRILVGRPGATCRHHRRRWADR
jgi:hypothetical protein